MKSNVLQFLATTSFLTSKEQQKQIEFQTERNKTKHHSVKHIKWSFSKLNKPRSFSYCNLKNVFFTGHQSCKTKALFEK